MNSDTYEDFAGGPRSANPHEVSEADDEPRYQVLHQTVFEYAIPVSESINTLHLEPRTFPFQRTLSAFIKVLPATRLGSFPDLFENVAHHFEILQPHYRLEIEGRVKVQTSRLVLPDVAYSGDEGYYNDPDVWQTTWLFKQPSHYVSRSAEIWRQAIDLTNGKAAIYEKVTAMMQWVHTHFRYDGSSTDVNTHIQEALTLRAGVCQDFAHVLIGLCRAIDLPARYASGYIYNGQRDNLVGAQASHAWTEVYLPEVGWIGFDPTNNTLADERYIKVAVGRDYNDVAPIKGSYKGTSQCVMSVSVNVDKLN